VKEAHSDNRPLLYLDIDGVLLRRRHSGMFDGFELAPRCLAFLEWATLRFRCRWLSMRCRTGFLDGSRRAFRSAGAPLDDTRWAVLNLIEPAAWSVNKPEAIDPTSDFWWVDDNVSAQDRDWLRAHNREDRLIEISSDRDPDALLHARSVLPGGSPGRRPEATLGMKGGDTRLTGLLENSPIRVIPTGRDDD
jgi:hypothetical protein